MRTSMLIILSLSMFLATTTKAIRLIEEKSIFDSATNSEIHQKKSSFKEEGSWGASKEIECGSQGHCAGSFRKLIVSKMSTTKMIKRSKDAVGADSAQSNQQHIKEESSNNHEDQQAAPMPVPPPVTKLQTHLDILDIVGMDYSHAKRKSPIHN